MMSTIVIKTPATSRLLAHPDRVIADLGLDTDDVAVADVIRFIAGASAAISSYLNMRRDDDGNVTIARETVIETWRRGVCEAYPDRSHAIILGRSPATVVSITEDGAITRRRIGGSDGAIAEGETAFTSATGPEGSPFTAAMIGQPITIAGAGAGGGAHVTTIADLIDDDEVELADPALTTVASGGVYALDNPGFLYDVAGARGMIWKRSAANLRQPFTASTVAVEYEAGWTAPDPDDADAAYTLPRDIEDACVIFVRRKLEQLRPDDQGRVESESFPGIGSWKFALQAVTWDGGLPSDVIDMLKPYRRRHL